MEEKISIIIPIYKVEKYIKRCIDSIIEQEYKNLEIILVDDGSPDNCPEICDEYAEKDNRVIVIHKENGGLSDARNYGMKRATGNWIVFVDSDDYISKDFVSYLYNLVRNNNSEIGITSPIIFYEDKKFKEYTNKKEKIIIMDKKNALKEMLYQKIFDTSAWGKIYKKEVLENVLFPCGKLYEDISTIYKVILNSNRIVYSNQKKYFYLKRKDSIMGRKFKNNDMDYIYQTSEMFSEIKKIKDKELVEAAKCRFINANFSILLKINKCDKKSNFKQEIYKNIKKYRKDVFWNKEVRIKTKIAIILYIFI